MSSLFNAHTIVKALRLPLEWASDVKIPITQQAARITPAMLDKTMLRIEEQQNYNTPEAIRMRAEARREELRACLEGRRAHAAQLRQQAEQARAEARQKRAQERLLEQQSGQAQAFQRMRNATMAKARELRGMASTWAKRLATQLQGGVLWSYRWACHWAQQAAQTLCALGTSTCAQLYEAARELEARARWLDNGTAALVSQHGLAL